MQAIMVGCGIALLIVLALWKMHSVLFMFAGGIAWIAACYMADIVSGGTTDNLSLSLSLSFLGIGFLLLAYSFRMMFKRNAG